MALQVEKFGHLEGLEQHGDNWRIERYFKADPDGLYTWGVYEQVATGTKPESGVIADHPVHGAPTTASHVWVKRFSGKETPARAFLAKHAK